MTKATLQQREALEHVYRTEPWPIGKRRLELLAQEVNLDYEWIKRWMSRRRGKDQGSLEGQQPPQLQNLGQPQQQQQSEEDLALMLDELLSDDHEMTANPDAIQEWHAEMTMNTLISELRQVCHDSTLWAKDMNRRDVLNLGRYEGRFLHPTNNQPISEASKDLRVYAIDYKELAKMLFEGYWNALFPFLIANEEIIKVFPPRDSTSDYPDGSMKMIYKEFRLITPGAAKRKVNVLRACRQIKEGMLAVLEVSYEPDQVENGKESNCHRFPSGCVIEEINDGISRVTWVEHMGVSDVVPVSIVRRVAKVMLDLLRTLCERTSNQKTMCSSESRGFYEQERLNLMRLGHAMVKDLFHTISPDEALWSSSAAGVYASNYTLTQNREVAVGAITFNVPESPKSVLKILGDEHIRQEWDFLGGFKRVHLMKCYVTGEDSKISISLIEDPTYVNDTVLTQEVTVTEVGSLVVWSVVPRGISYHVSLGQELPLDSSSLLSIVSGFSITTANNTSGSVITLVLRTLVDGNQQSQQAIESITSVVNQTVARVRDALQKQRPPSPAVGYL